MTSSPTQSPRRQSVIVVAALLFVPVHGLLAESLSSGTPHPIVAELSESTDRWFALGGVGVIEVTDPIASEASASEDAQLSAALEQLEREVDSLDAARVRLVREHLRMVDGPRAMLDLDFAQQQFGAERAGVRAARQEVARQEDRMDFVRRDPSRMEVVARSRPFKAITEVRMELPARYLPSLQHSLRRGTDRVIVQASRATDRHVVTIATGTLASIESAPTDATAIVRARLDDPSGRLHTGDLVAVEVRLHDCTESARNESDEGAGRARAGL